MPLRVVNPFPRENRQVVIDSSVATTWKERPVVQAAGRLIRSADDTGVIALFDKRFMRRPYLHHLPEDWIPEGGARRLGGIREGG